VLKERTALVAKVAKEERRRKKKKEHLKTFDIEY
jgi:hypothetical protein